MASVAQLWLIYLITAVHITAFLLLFFWLRRRLGYAPPLPPKPERAPPPAAAPAAPAIPPDFPYRSVPLLSPEERALFQALASLNGDAYVVYPRVAASALVAPTKGVPGYSERLRGQVLDFVVADRKTGAVVSTLLLRAGGRLGPDEADWPKVASAADLPCSVLDASVKPDPAALRRALGLPEGLDQV